MRSWWTVEGTLLTGSQSSSVLSVCRNNQPVDSVSSVMGWARLLSGADMSPMFAEWANWKHEVLIPTVVCGIWPWVLHMIQIVLLGREGNRHQKRCMRRLVCQTRLYFAAILNLFISSWSHQVCRVSGYSVNCKVTPPFQTVNSTAVLVETDTHYLRPVFWDSGKFNLWLEFDIDAMWRTGSWNEQVDTIPDLI